MLYSSKLLNIYIENYDEEGYSLHITNIYNFDLYEDLNVREELSKKVKILIINKYEYLIKTLKNIFFLDQKSFPKVITIDNVSLITLLDKNRFNLHFKESLSKLDRLFSVLTSLLFRGKSFYKDFK